MKVIDRNEKRCFRLNCGTRIIFSLLLAGLIVCQASIAGTQQRKGLDKRLEQAILTEDWEKVVNILCANDEPNLPAVLRLVKAQACLATNRNNESSCLFSSTTSKEDLQKWQKWSHDFATRYPGIPIAYYLKGDSHARLMQWNRALCELNKALKIDPNHALALNARGVINAIKEDWTKANIDFMNAARVDPNLADVYANLGVRNIQRKTGPEGALRWFNCAIEISPDFALALEGRGCVELVLNFPEKAKKDFAIARKRGTCMAPLLAENLISIEAYMNGMNKEELLVVASGKGERTSLNKFYGTFDGWKERPTQNLLNDTLRTYEGLDNKSQLLASDYMREQIGSNGYLGQLGLEQSNRGIYTNSDGNLFRETLKNTPDLFGVGHITDNILKQQDRRTEDWGQFKDVFRDSLKTIGSEPHGPFDGVQSSFAAANWDDGNWPFIAYYGLLYDVGSTEASVKTASAQQAKEANDEDVR